MARKFSTWNHYNIVGYYDAFQEHVRAVKYLPENRLICVTNAHWDRYWEHPEDIGIYERMHTLPTLFTDDDNPFAEADFCDLADAGWVKYLQLAVGQFDFNETVIRDADFAGNDIALHLTGGYLVGRDLIPSDDLHAPPTVLTLRNPKITLALDKGNLANRDLTDSFPGFWRNFAAGQSVDVTGFLHGGDLLYLRLQNSAGHLIAVTFRAQVMYIQQEETP